MKKDKRLFWSVTALLLAANILHLSLQQDWTVYVLAVCTGIYLAGAITSAMWRDRRFKRTMQAHKRNDALFWATLENMRLIGESEMEWEDKERALLHLREQYRKALEQETT